MDWIKIKNENTDSPVVNILCLHGFSCQVRWGKSKVIGSLKPIFSFLESPLIAQIAIMQLFNGLHLPCWLHMAHICEY